MITPRSSQFLLPMTSTPKATTASSMSTLKP